MKHGEIYSAAQLTAFIHKVGFLPLLDSGIRGFSAEEVVADDCRYVAGDGRCSLLPRLSWSVKIFVVPVLHKSLSNDSSPTTEPSCLMLLTGNSSD